MKCTVFSVFLPCLADGMRLASIIFDAFSAYKNVVKTRRLLSFTRPATHGKTHTSVVGQTLGSQHGRLPSGWWPDTGTTCRVPRYRHPYRVALRNWIAPVVKQLVDRCQPRKRGRPRTQPKADKVPPYQSV